MELNPSERIDMLYASNIKVIQSPEVFSFSLDAVLLADFARPSRKTKGKVVDLCAGNGAVALFLTDKTPAAITAVEIQPRLADMAQRSVQLNHLEGQVSVLPIAAQKVFDYVPKDSVDTVTCNPPYFADLPQSRKNPNQYLAIARHEIAINLEEIVAISSGLLKTKGKLFLIQRPERFSELLELFPKYHLAVNEVRLVYPKAAKAANMVLIEAIKYGSKTGIKFLPPLTVYDQTGKYTQPIKEMLYGK
ncbi:MAG: tRNA1(Val) (adenine(37)-N6)-methyltransferase [Liquorilactobacillus ghanensis]|uniref:tRNA1(Val) (adenine(37)-N6)-methyltransferase n=1 Tax=Liquorilactobacillus ghanensis TaxID=399370 RepID=UPI0039EB7FD9